MAAEPAGGGVPAMAFTCALYRSRGQSWGAWDLVAPVGGVKYMGNDRGVLYVCVPQEAPVKDGDQLDLGGLEFLVIGRKECGAEALLAVTPFAVAFA